jgi:glycosyltransferase involved in cell wall biosynthesis
MASSTLSTQALITIVMPTWNRLPFVEDAARSVIAQTYPRWELIVVDDGSTDGTAGRLHALGEPRLRVLSLNHSGRLGHLRNRGAAAGTGELIAFLDSDDVWLPQKLELQVRALDDASAGWCYAGYDMMDMAGRATERAAGTFRALSGRIVKDVLTYRVTAPLTALIVRRSLFEKVGGFSEDATLIGREDQELNLRLALHSDAIALPDVLARMRDHSGRTTRALSQPYERSARVFEVFLASKPPADLARLARRYWAREIVNAGRHKLATGRLRDAARLFGRSLIGGAEFCLWSGALVRGLRDWMRGRQQP